jgi:uncharacterized membrane protein HdeD (DUF308 family)
VNQPDNGAMTPTDSRTGKKLTRANHDLLQKGILITIIGLAVLLAPYFVRSPELKSIVANSALVGWFSLVLGLALLVRYVVQRRTDR